MTAKMTGSHKLALSALLSAALLAVGAPQASAALPTLTNEAPGPVTDTAATLNGTVNTDSTLSDCRFEHVTPAAYERSGFSDLSSGGSVPCAQAPGSIPLDATTPVSAEIGRSGPNAPVYYRLVAENASGPAAASFYRGFGYGVAEFDGSVLQSNGDPATQAGSHPFTANTHFVVSNTIADSGRQLPTENFKDAIVDLPPGLVGNPQAVAECTLEQLSAFSGLLGTPKCPPESQVGIVRLGYGGPSGGDPGFTESPASSRWPVYNMQAPPGKAAVFAFNVLKNLVTIEATVRSGGDYGIDVTSRNAPESLPWQRIDFTFWGVPGDPAHDVDRYCGTGFSFGCPSADSANPKPFLSLPTSCVGPVETGITLTSWLGSSGEGSFLSHDNTEPVPNPIGADGCNAVPFEPTIEARPTTTTADSPSGLDVDLGLPQSEDPEGVATAHLKDTTVTLPEGLVVNPSAANGLDGCSPEELGLTTSVGRTPIRTTAGPADCPDASKLGTVEVDSPLVENPLNGFVYLAEPHENPFESLIALYIAVDDRQTGIVVKLAGEVTPDRRTGQLSATFEDNPQLPFEHFRLRFFGGAGGSLRTPASCGEYTTESSMTPWTAPDSGPPATPSDSWTIERSAGGGSCPSSPAAQPNAPSFDAGTVTPIAGAHSPFVVHLRREDGTQPFSAVTLTPPPGLSAKLAGTPACPDAALAMAAAKTGLQEKASPSCPPFSEVGSVVAGAGAGPAPYYAPGKAYIGGPYKGAPLSLAIVTPATAGPFDLGTIVVRTALYINPRTAQLTAVSDPIPSILEGIPLDVRTVDISIDRPQFTKNPTSCDPLAVAGLLTSTFGQPALLSSRFQVGECGRLGFKPRLSLRLFGGAKRGKYQALRAVVRPRPGDANISRTVVRMPRSAFLAQENIRTICTRVQFAADACPEGAIYGQAVGYSPLLDYPLRGNVYLRSSDNTLPDLVADLRGPAHQPIRIELVGRTDSVKRALRNTFDVVPDAPVSYFRMRLFGGKRGLIVNSRNICRGKNEAVVRLDAQNGIRRTLRPVVGNPRCKKLRRAAKRRAAKQRARHRRAAWASLSDVRRIR